MNFLLDSYSKRFHVQDISCWLDKSLQHPSKKFLVKIHCIFQKLSKFTLSENSHDSIDISEDMFSHTLLDITASGFGMQFSKEAVSSLLNLSLSSTSFSHTYQNWSSFCFFEYFSFKLLKSLRLIFDLIISMGHRTFGYFDLPQQQT